MLCQLVCLDRRYQRMNCFNIREVEALLKGRFFPDLINTHDHRLMVINSTLGLRFKTNNLDTINHGLLLFHQYGLQTVNQSRYAYFVQTNKTCGTSYEFFYSGSLRASVINSIVSYLFLIPNLVTVLFSDMGLLFTYTFYPLRSCYTSTRRGYLTHLEFCNF